MVYEQDLPFACLFFFFLYEIILKKLRTIYKCIHTKYNQKTATTLKTTKCRYRVIWIRIGR